MTDYIEAASGSLLPAASLILRKHLDGFEAEDACGYDTTYLPIKCSFRLFVQNWGQISEP